MLSLGIDIGTSGVRTAVIRGNKLLSASSSNHIQQSTDKIDAAKWWFAVEECLLRQLYALRDLGLDPREICGISVDGTSGSMVLTDANLVPVSPALMYSSDGFDEEAEVIKSYVGADHITSGGNSALARAMRLVSIADGKPRHLMHQADYVAGKLIGHGGQTDYNNALKTGCDPIQELWPDWIDELFNSKLLPKISAPGTPIGTVSKRIAKRLGLEVDTMVYAGTTDSVAAFIAAGKLEEGCAVTSLGSTLVVKILSEKRVEKPEIGLYSHRLGKYWLPGGASNSGGAVLRNFFQDDELESISNQINSHVSTNLDFYPLLGPGERFPINNPHFEPRLTPRPNSDVLFLQGMFEGIARIEANCYRTISSLGGAFPKIVFTSGGGAHNKVWTKIRANFLGVTPVTAIHTEAAVGAAQLATGSWLTENS